MKKTVSWIMLSLLVFSMLPLVFNIQSAKASGTIYIRADGSIDPSTSPIQRYGNIYTLTGNILTDSLKDGIVVQKDNIVIDGAGYTVQGTEKTGIGINLTKRSYVTIKNIEIKAFEHGIRLSSSHHNKMYGISITANGFHGVLLHHSSNNNISGNFIATNTYSGLWFNNSSKNYVSGNNITNNNYGIFLTKSSDNSISRNNITNAYRAIYLQEYSNYNSISGNTMAHNNFGVHLAGSSNNQVSGNVITINNWTGIYLDSSRYNMIFLNNITSSNDSGIRLQDSSNNLIVHNNFVDNFHQIYDVSWDDSNVSPSINTWDDGYPSGGNYWSDYDGWDANYDGIGDTSYTIDGNNFDRYPHVAPIIIPEFPLAMILLLFMILTALVVILAKRKLPIKTMQVDKPLTIKS